MTELKVWLVAESFPDSAPIAAVFTSEAAALAYCAERVIDTIDPDNNDPKGTQAAINEMRRAVAGTMGFDLPGEVGHCLTLSVDTLAI